MSFVLSIISTHSLFAKLNNTFHPIYTSEKVTLNECHNIIKDDDGFLWITYAEGVARYDGSSVKEYPLEYNFHRVVRKLSGGDIVALVEDVGFSAAKYDPIEDKYIDITTFIGEINTSAQILCSVTDDYNNLWLGTSDGVVCYSGDNHNWVYLNVLRGARVEAIIPLDDKLALIESGQIHYLNVKSELLQTLYLSNCVIGCQLSPTATYFDDETNTIYFGTDSDGLIAYNIESGEHRKYPSVAFGGVKITSICGYYQNKLLVGTDGSGIYIVDKSNGELLRQYCARDGYNSTIESNAIYDIYVDSHLRIYAATYAYGVQVLDPNALDYTVMSPRLENRQSINTAVNSLFQSGDQLWVGTDAGLFSHNINDKSWRRYSLEDGDKSSHVSVVMDVEPVGDALYVSCYGHGLLMVDRSRGVLRPVASSQQQVEGSNSLFSLYYGGGPLLWMGGACGITSYGLNDHSMCNYGQRGGVSSITNMSGQSLIYSAGYDLYILDRQSKQVVPFNIPDVFVNQIGVQPKVHDIRRYRDMLLFATHNCGLIEYNMRSDEFVSYQSILGEDYRNILALEIDHSGNAWVTSSKGVAFVNRSQRYIRSYKSSSLSGVGSFVKGASLITERGSVLFGTQSGVMVIDTEDIHEVQVETKPRIEDFNISYKSVRNSHGVLDIDRPLNEIEMLELSYDQNTFSFTLGSIDYSQYDAPVYSWRLCDFYDEWVPITKNNIAEYRNVPAGEYDFQFRVYASLNSDEYITKSVKIRVLQPWYLSWQMMIVYIILMAIAVFVTTHLLIKRQERIASQERIDYYMNALHSIYTPVMLAKAPLEYLRRELGLSENSKHLIAIVSKNLERIYALTSRQLDYKAVLSDNDFMVQEVSLADYYREMMDLFWEYALSNNVTLKLSLNKPNRSIYTQREVLDKIMDNLISNSIKYSLNSGNVTIDVDYNSDYWFVKIHNMGCLIPSNERRYIFKRLYRAENSVNSLQPSSGLGLFFTYKLVHQIGGSISFDSDSQCGTTFTIKLPIIIPNHGAEMAIAQEDNEEPTIASRDRIIIFDEGDKIYEFLVQRFSGDYIIEQMQNIADIRSSENRGKVAMILLNITSPNLAYEQLCGQLRAEDSLRGVGILAITSNASDEIMALGAEYNVIDMLPVPFELEQLEQRLICLLSASVSGAVVDERPTMSDVDSEFMRQVEHIIKCNIANHDFNIDMICEALCMSRSVFYNRMKSITSLTPNEMLRNARMRYAAELLQSKRYSINEVSDMVGFADAKYFKRVFFKFHNCHPGDYIG